MADATDGKGVPVYQARNQLAKILEQARYFDGVTFLTNRGQRVAAVVPVELAELAEECGGPARLVELVRTQRARES